MATGRLRRLAGLSGGGPNARRFDRAIAELQMGFQIVKVGISDANRWAYSYVYDLFLRRFPHVPEIARKISIDTAMETLLRCYLRNVGVQTEAATRRLFRWDEWEWDRLLTRLTEQNIVLRDVQVEGLRGPCLALAEAHT